MEMKIVFDHINSFFEFIVPISDFFWDVPTNYAWYASIPILGRFPLSLLILIGAGIFFTIKLKGLQVTNFGRAIKILATKKAHETGVSPWSAFLLSSAMRVGPGNIMGVTGAISVGGPGALFWMWVCAFFGMATAYVESTLAQIFKEKKDKEFVGGVPFYGRVLLGGKPWVGSAIAITLITAFLLNVPGQAFHLFTALGSVAEIVTGNSYERTSTIYYGIAIILSVSVPLIIFGGIRRVTKFTDALVPVMAIIYCGMVVLIILFNLDKVPYFFSEVFGGAFAPKPIFGGMIGTVIVQGVRRGLMSNEAGQGTITTAAAISDNTHPCEQGFIQSVGVFVDTMVICTLTGFIVVMAHLWTGESGVEWEVIRSSRLPTYLASISSLVSGKTLSVIVMLIVSLSYALFAFTTLIGLISFSEISVNRISQSKSLVLITRVIGAIILLPFGCLTVLAGLELGNLWYIADFSNILLVFVNVPIILVGFKIVEKSTKHYFASGGGKFISKDVIGMETDSWNK